jgi:hypothetical protein
LIDVERDKYFSGYLYEKRKHLKAQIKIKETLKTRNIMALSAILLSLSLILSF